MTLTIGDSNSMVAISPTPPPSTPDEDESTPTPPTPTPTPAAVTPSPQITPPATQTPPPTSALPATVSLTPDDVITLTFSFAIQSSRAISELEHDQHFIGGMKKVGLKILGLSGDKIGWISVVLTQANVRRLGPHFRRRLSASMNVEYSAQIPKDASEDVSIASDPSAIEIEVQTAIQD